ncbi:MAG: nucleotidyltransferase domain-containing protein [Phycisphaerales bacterium]|nr:nucleotidyltransferase domain-containing protein [Phycisphaerales bacterium]
MNLPLDQLRARVTAHPHPLIFATISGAHLYGFPSPDSDFDLRGAHILPLPKILGLDIHDETIEISNDPATDPDHLEFDIVSHDIKKFFTLLLKKNGYVLEQLYSPLIIHTTPAHAELKSIATGCITKHHGYHYLGFADTQWKLFSKESPHRVKPLLYTYRVLLTGIHLMRTGQIEANLNILNDSFQLPYIPDLIARKTAGPEQSTLDNADYAFHESEFHRLYALLQTEHERSSLPESPTARSALNDLLIRLRTGC